MNILTGVVLSATVLCGDVSLNGSVSSVDAHRALKMAVFGGYSVEADVVADGTITVSDAYTILTGGSMGCPDIVDISIERPIEAINVYINTEGGPGFLGTVEEAACVFHPNFYESIAANIQGHIREHQYFYMENFLGVGAFIAPWPDSPFVSGIIATCLAYPDQEFRHVESWVGPGFLTEEAGGGVIVKVR